jgi:hypothetical protein
VGSMDAEIGIFEVEIKPGRMGSRRPNRVKTVALLRAERVCPRKNLCLNQGCECCPNLGGKAFEILPYTSISVLKAGAATKFPPWSGELLYQ